MNLIAILIINYSIHYYQTIIGLYGLNNLYFFIEVLKQAI